jgi:hypothetical protein
MVLLAFSRRGTGSRFKTQVLDSNSTTVNSFINWKKNRRGKFNTQVTTEAVTTSTQQPNDSPFVPGKFVLNKRKKNPLTQSIFF